MVYRSKVLENEEKKADEIYLKSVHNVETFNMKSENPSYANCWPDLDNFEIECILGSHHKISRRKDICSSETLETNIGEHKPFFFLNQHKPFLLH